MVNRNQYVAGVIVAVTVVAIVLYFILTLSSHGTIKTIGVDVCWDEALTQKVTDIDWGRIGSGESKEVDLWVKNTGNTSINMTMEVRNWNPSNAGDYLTMTWNYSGQELQTGEKIFVTLKLTASGNIPFVAFSNDIVITAWSNE